MKKIKNKKSLLAIVAAMFIVVIGVTYAVFNSVSTRENEFSVGNYSFITMESFESPTDWLPGETIDKTIYGMNNGDIPVAFRIKYEERWEDASGEPISNVPQNTVTINFINTAHWIYNNDDGYYYHKYYIGASESSCSIISGVTLNEDLMGSASCEMVGDSYNCTSDLDGLAGAKYILTFTKEAVAYNKYQDYWGTDFEITDEPPLIQIMNENRTKDSLQVGDEICINGTESTECFNFIGYDGNNVKMLAKYNLKVGYIFDSGENDAVGYYETTDHDYCLQASDAKGYVTDNSLYRGTVPFSGTNYWNSGGLKAKYGSSYPAEVYDTDYSDPYGTDYSIAYYMEYYKAILSYYGMTVSDVRPITYDEITGSGIGCNGNTNTCPTNGFITNSSFWMARADDASGIWGVYSTGGFADLRFDRDSFFGVRPVVVISKSNM